ncbi:YetF domain-containing protein [Paenibacillus sp. strain BS8-2]
MELWSLLIRTTVIYFVVFLIMRLMGKREIGKLSVLDLIISVMIAEIAVIVIEDVNRPLWDGVVPMIVLLVIQVTMALLTMSNRKLRLFFDGKPSVVIAKGKINRDVMRKQRYNLDDLMLQLRENKITSVADVEFAILETSGKLSVIPKDESGESGAQEAERKSGPVRSVEDSGIRSVTDKLASQHTKEKTTIPVGYRFEILPIPLIMDGKVQDENLAKIEKTRFWLKNALQEENVHDFKEVFLCTIDHKGRLFVDVQNKFT